MLLDMHHHVPQIAALLLHQFEFVVEMFLRVMRQGISRLLQRFDIGFARRQAVAKPLQQ